MDRTSAISINLLISIIFEKINDVLFIANNQSDIDFRKKVQESIGKVIIEFDIELLESIYKEYPDLRPPDMDEVSG